MQINYDNAYSVGIISSSIATAVTDVIDDN